ncbi:MAG: HEAT repeat domain-containing protein, partial [Acinetobacter sp.]
KVEAVYKIFLPLAEIEQDLHKEVLTFIFEGENPNVLLKLNSLPDEKALFLLGKPGTYAWYWSNIQLDKKQNKLAENSIQARRQFYGKMFEYLDAAQIIRFAKVLEAAAQQKNFKNLYDKVPAWFIYLTIDIYIIMFENRKFSESDPTKEIKNNLSLEQFRQLLEYDQEGLGEELLAYLFERRDIDSYHRTNLNRILETKDCTTYITARLDQLKHVIPTLSVTGQEIFLDYIAEKNDVLTQIPDLVVKLSVGKSKTIRTKATSLLAQLNSHDSQKYLSEFLREGSSQERSFSADLLARLGADNLEILEQALAQEKQKSVQQNLQMAIQRLQSVDSADQIQHFDIPAMVPLLVKKIPQSFTQDILDNYKELLEKAEQALLDEIEYNKVEPQYKRHWAKDGLKQLKEVKESTLLATVDALNNDKPMIKYHRYENIITYKNKYKKYPEFSIVHAARLLSYQNRDWIYWANLFEMLNPAEYSQYELRDLVQALEIAKFIEPKRKVAKGILIGSFYYSNLKKYISDPEKIWPFFAENTDFLTEALGLSPSLEKNQYQAFNASDAIYVLKCFPSIPSQFIPRLLEFALGENKRLRFDAQQALQNIPNIHQRAIEALESGKQEIRITAIEWLARLQHSEAIKPLNALLKKEKKEVVRAALLTALEKLGEDISAYLKPTVLLKEAELGLKAKLSASFVWFDFKTLPKATWLDGKEVDPHIIQWWVVLAEKLKEPKANALLQRYISLLDEKSQQQLANHLLQSFIHQDTLNPTLDEATAHATQEAPGRLSHYRDMYKRYGEKYPEYYG